MRPPYNRDAVADDGQIAFKESRKGITMIRKVLFTVFAAFAIANACKTGDFNDSTLIAVPGIGSKTLAAIRAAGNIPMDSIETVKGIGPKKAAEIKKLCK